MTVTRGRRVLVALLIVACACAAGADDPLAAAKEFLAKYEAWHGTRHLRSLPHPMPSRAECLAALPHLRLALQEGDAELRQRVINAAAWMYPLSDGFADALVEMLEDKDEDVRTRAAAALAAFLPDAGIVVPALQKPLADEEAEVREAAAFSLGILGPSSASARDALEEQAESDPDPRARAAAVETVACTDPARGIAIRGLANGGTDALAAVPALIELMVGLMPMSAQARTTLCRLGPVAGPLLAEQLRSDDPKRVYEAAIVFQCMGDQASPWLDDIFNAWLRWQTAGGQTYDAAGFTSAALVALGEKAVPRLLDVVDREEGGLGDRAAATISRIEGPALLPFAERLEGLARRFPQRHRLRCALPRLYAEHPDGRARLLALMRDPELVVRIEACRIRRVKRWEGQDVVAALTDAAGLETPDALMDLANMGPQAAAALPTLLAIAQDPDRYRRNLYYLNALEPIAAIGPGEKGLELLRAALASDRAESILGAALAIWKAPSAEAARLAPDLGASLAPDLRAALERELARDKPDVRVLERLGSALGHAQPRSEANHALFQKVADDPRADISRAGQEALKLEERRAERTGAWLSSEAARMVYAGREDRGGSRLLEEVADTGDPRALPALRLAAACGPTEDFRALAARLIERMR